MSEIKKIAIGQPIPLIRADGSKIMIQLNRLDPTPEQQVGMKKESDVLEELHNRVDKLAEEDKLTMAKLEELRQEYNQKLKPTGRVILKLDIAIDGDLNVTYSDNGGQNMVCGMRSTFRSPGQYYGTIWEEQDEFARLNKLWPYDKWTLEL